MFRILGLAAALLLTMTTPARAQLRAISDGATPVVSGARVLWGERVGATMHLVSAPLSGGPAVPFGDVPVGARDVMWLAASPGLVAAQLRDAGSRGAAGRLFAAGPDGAFRLVADDVGEEPFDALWRWSRSPRPSRACAARSRSRASGTAAPRAPA